MIDPTRGARHYDVVAFVGSLRSGSYNRMLFNNVRRLSPANMAISELTGWDEWQTLDVDLLNDGIPDAVTAMAQRIAESDAVLFVSPEYNYSIPGGLKNGIDWLSRVSPQPFTSKVVGIMGASTGAIGTARMQYHLRQVLVFLDGHPVNKPEVMVGRAAGEFDGEGRLVSEFYRTQVTELLENLARQADRFKD